MCDLANRNLNSLLGKSVCGVQTSNYTGAEASEIVLKFTDGSTLVLSNEWLDSGGWSAIQIEVRDHV